MKVTRNSSLKLALLGAGALGWLSLVRADFATCVPGWEWSYNSQGQNPCEIAGSLQAPCLGFSVYTLGPIGNDSNYVTPQSNDAAAQKCGCNTIIYSLYQACTLCQFSTNRTAITWAFWAQFCTQVYVTQYPFSIPYNASVPHWAYLNDTNPGFDPVLAQAAGRDPQATPTGPPTVSIPSTVNASPSTHSGQSSLSNSLSTNANPSSTNSAGGNGGGNGGGSNSDNNGGGKTSHTGAIAGGVVGGIVGVAALGALAFFFLKRRRGDGSGNLVGGVQTAYHPGGIDHPLYEGPKLYNPADPSTFPDPVSAGDSSNSGGFTTNSYQGRYQGAAEL